METTVQAPPVSTGTGTAPNWRVIAVIAALVLVAWWVWRQSSKTKPDVPLRSNDATAPLAPPGIPLTLTEKMARAVDTVIPVVMTSGTLVPHDDDEIRQLVRKVFSRLNAMGEAVTLIKVVSASKTQDSYKTVSYEMVLNAHDAVHNVGVMLTLAVLIPASGKLYVRQFRLYHDAEKTDPGPGAASEPAGLAAYEDPMKVLQGMKL